MSLSKDAFRDRFGENPRQDDLTILVPKQDDPTEQTHHETCMDSHAWAACPAYPCHAGGPCDAMQGSHAMPCRLARQDGTEIKYKENLFAWPGRASRCNILAMPCSPFAHGQSQDDAGLPDKSRQDVLCYVMA
eukprot:365802-Chlamydomonas_euryale.AAC.9